MFHSLHWRERERERAMGTCASKCCFNPSPPFDSKPPQDKLVISQSPSTPTNPLSIALSNVQSTPTSSSSSSSSSSCSSSSSSSYSSISNSTYPWSSLTDRSFTNEFLLSCARENPPIIVLDPHKYCATKPKPHRYLVKTLPKPSIVQGPQEQSTARANQSLPSKRARSGSPPTLVGRKSFKSELSSANAQNKQQRRVVGTSGNAIPLHLGASKEKNLCYSSPYNLSSRQISSVEKKREIRVHEIHQQHHQRGQKGSREAFSDQSSRTPLMEDLNNPLISMDCFIFL